MAAVGAHRTGRMGDIVATIQAEQDRVIRSDLAGVLGRAGRPGHRQDGRGAAPRGVPALHPPRPAGPQRRAARRAQPALPALHRAGAARRSARPASCWRPPASSTPASTRRRRAATPRSPRSRATCGWRRVLSRAVRDRQRVPDAAAQAGRRRRRPIDADGRRGGRAPGRGPGVPASRTTRPARASCATCWTTWPRELARGPRAGRSTPTAARTCSPTCATARTCAASSTWPGCRCRPKQVLADLYADPRPAGRGGAAS